MIEYLNLKTLNARYADEIQQAVRSTIESGLYLKSEQTHKFEQAYAQYIGTKHCVGCGNGLDALTLMLRAYMIAGKLKEGDQVLIPANTYIATILAVIENRLLPVFAEPDPHTAVLTGDIVEQYVDTNLKAVLTVHLFGRCACDKKMLQLCNEHHLLLFEDNAQAHGCLYNDKRTGSLGNAAAHSFYPTKNLGALGDAGAITTNDDGIAELLRAIGNYGSSQKYVFPYRGRNSRIDEIQAAVLSVKLKHLDSDNKQRQALARVYINKVENPKIRLINADGVHHIFPIFSKERDQLRNYLLDAGIETAVHYPIAPHEQGALREWSHLHLPITEALHDEEISLPCNPSMTTEQAEYIADVLNQW